MFSLRQYLIALDDSPFSTRTLGRFEVLRDAEGRMLYSSGNSAIVFRIRHQGVEKALRVYRRTMPRLKEIYGDRCLERELYLSDMTGGRWVDVVLTDWIEGVTLDVALSQAIEADDVAALTALSAHFDRMAAMWVADDWAHGDLKPENIVVDPEGGLHLIDLDALFLPEFAGQRSAELGTVAYQHPNRTVDHFHAALDDYPAALIATALHLLRLRSEVARRANLSDSLLFTPSKIATNPWWIAALRLFEERGWAAQYRIAQALVSPSLRIRNLATWLDAAHMEVVRDAEPAGAPIPELTDGGYPELYVDEGFWGFRDADRVVIPPIYDGGFDFTEGLAAVQVGRTWHYIDRTGRVVLHGRDCEAVKPFHDGVATVIRDGCRCRMDRSGKIIL